MKQLQQIQPLNAEQRSLHSKQGYFAAYERIKVATSTRREAWQILEDEYERIFGVPRYSEFSNFCRIRVEYYKLIKNNLK